MLGRLEFNRRKKLAAEEMGKLARQGQSVGLRKATSNLFRHNRQQSSRLDLGGFDQVISIDTDAATVDAGGRTTYEALVAETLRHGFLPPVVPQLKTITVGGAIAGGGIEASSFRHGFVHESVEEMEVLLSDGRLVTCREDNEHRDLFYGMANSYATLGYVLRAKLPLVRALPFVELTHHRFEETGRCFQFLKDLCLRERKHGEAGFIDGTVFGARQMYVTVGRFVERAPWTSDYRFMRIYYRSIREREVDYLSAEDFIWRWDTDWFWCSRSFGMEVKPIRFLFGACGALRSPVYWKMRDWAVRSGLLKRIERRNPREYVIQDVEVPVERAEEFLRFLLERVGILPVWVCPVKSPHPEKQYPLYRMDPRTLYINFGFWGSVARGQREGQCNREIEQRVIEMKGRKSLYSTSFFPESEFWEIYNEKAYRRLKQQYDPQGRLRDLYEKCVGRSERRT